MHATLDDALCEAEWDCATGEHRYRRKVVDARVVCSAYGQAFACLVDVHRFGIALNGADERSFVVDADPSTELKFKARSAFSGLSSASLRAMLSVPAPTRGSQVPRACAASLCRYS